MSGPRSGKGPKVPGAEALRSWGGAGRLGQGSRMIEMDSPPKLTHLSVLASCPDELLRLGAMVGAFAAGGTAVRAVLLSDGLPRDAMAELRLERNHRLTRAANGV